MALRRASKFVPHMRTFDSLSEFSRFRGVTDCLEGTLVDWVAMH